MTDKDERDRKREEAFEKWQSDDTNGFHVDDCGDGHFELFDGHKVAQAAFSAGFQAHADLAAGAWVRIVDEDDAARKVEGKDGSK